MAISNQPKATTNQQKTHEKEKDLEITPFSQLDSLKERWQNQELKLKDIIQYNKWSMKENSKIREIELRLEHYLCNNLLVDIEGQNNLFQNPKCYFDNNAFEDKKFIEVIERLKLKQKHYDKSPSIARIKELSLGQKITIFNYLKEDIFQNKFWGIKTKPHIFIIALWNVNYARNGIAHLYSKAQIFNRMRRLDHHSKVLKEHIYQRSIKICREMQQNKREANV